MAQLEQSSVDPVQFRHVVGHLASGVTVLTTELNGVRHGMTASSVTSLSMRPPMMLACINSSVPTASAVSSAGAFVVNVLGEAQGVLAQQFAAPSPDKFRGVHLRLGQLGLPVLSQALAHIECRVVEEVRGGTHTIFLGSVAAAEAGNGHPLTYYRGGFGRFEFARDDGVYRAVRERVLHRYYDADDVLEVEGVARALGVDQPAAFYALTRLASDGLVHRDPVLGYVVSPFDAHTSDVTFEARLAIELGVIDRVVGSVDPDRAADLLQKLDVMATLLIGDRFVDFDAYLAANYRLHQAIVGLADNSLLNDMFDDLSIKTVMTRSFGTTPETSQEFVRVQRDLVAYILDGDRVRARAAAVEYCELAKARVRQILVHTDGRL